MSPSSEHNHPAFVIVDPDGNPADAEGAFDPTTETQVSVSAAYDQGFPTHVILTSGTKTTDPPTKWGRQLLEETVGPDRLTDMTKVLKTVTIKSKLCTCCGCTEVFDDLSEEAKALGLDTVVLHHNSSPAGFDRDCLLNSYGWCLNNGKLPLKSKHFVAATATDGGNSAAARKYAELVGNDNEKIHIGIYNPTDSRQTAVDDTSAPRSVSLVDVALNSEGSHPTFGPRVSTIDEEAAQKAIEQQIARFPGLSAERKRPGGTGTPYDFVDRSTFDSTAEGKVLAEYRVLSDA